MSYAIIKRNSGKKWTKIDHTSKSYVECKDYLSPGDDIIFLGYHYTPSGGPEYVLTSNITYGLDMPNFLHTIKNMTPASMDECEKEHSKECSDSKADNEVEECSSPEVRTEKVNARISSINLAGDSNQQFLVVEFDTGSTYYKTHSHLYFDDWADAIKKLFMALGEGCFESWVGTPVVLVVAFDEEGDVYGIIEVQEFLTGSSVIKCEDQRPGTFMDDRFDR